MINVCAEIQSNYCFFSLCFAKEKAGTYLSLKRMFLMHNLQLIQKTEKGPANSHKGYPSEIKLEMSTWVMYLFLIVFFFLG